MKRTLVVRSLSLVLALVLSLAFMQPRLASAQASIGLSPTSGPAGTVVTVSGTGYGANQTVKIYFNGGPVQTTTANALGTIPANTTFTVPNVTAGGYSVVAASASAAANTTFTVTGTAALTTSKLVTVNGLGYSTTGTAHPNDTLTYAISVKNNTASSISGLTISDTIQGGQTLSLNGITGSQAFTCTYNSTARILTCTTPTLGAGVTAQLFFSTIVGNTTSTIPNTASITSTTGPSATTNTTLVTVTSGTPVVTSGSILLCGTVSGFVPPTATTAGTITIGGLTIPIAAAATITASTGFSLVNGANTCATITLSSGQAIAISATPNAPTVALVCGMFTTSTTAGFITVGGFPVQLVNGVSFVGLTVNVTYCFLLANGQVFAVLSGIPTSAQPLKRHGYAYRESFTRAE